MTDKNPIPDECPEFEVDSSKLKEATSSSNTSSTPPPHVKELMQRMLEKAMNGEKLPEQMTHVDDDGTEHVVGVLPITPQDMSMCYRAVVSVLWDITNDKMNFQSANQRDEVLRLYMRLSDKLKPLFDPRHLPGFADGDVWKD